MKFYFHVTFLFCFAILHKKRGSRKQKEFVSEFSIGQTGSKTNLRQKLFQQQANPVVVMPALS